MATDSKTAVTPDQIMRYAWGYAAPLILEAGVRNGLFDALADGPKTLADVRARTGASERGPADDAQRPGRPGLAQEGRPNRLRPDAGGRRLPRQQQAGLSRRLPAAHQFAPHPEVAGADRRSSGPAGRRRRSTRNTPARSSSRSSSKTCSRSTSPAATPWPTRWKLTRRPVQLRCSTWRPAPASGASPWRSGRRGCG